MKLKTKGYLFFGIGFAILIFRAILYLFHESFIGISLIPIAIAFVIMGFAYVKKSRKIEE